MTWDSFLDFFKGTKTIPTKDFVQPVMLINELGETYVAGGGSGGGSTDITTLAKEVTLASVLTSINNLLTELQLKADLSQTQPVNVQNQISGFATQTTLSNVLTSINNLLTELQLKADLSETQPITMPPKKSIGGWANVPSTLHQNMLNATDGTTPTDVRSFQSGMLYVISTGAFGAYIVESAYDAGFTVGVKPLPITEADVANQNPLIATISVTAATRIFYLNLQGVNYLRVRMSTSSAGAGNPVMYAVFNQNPYMPYYLNIQQTTAGNLNANVSGSVTANLSGSLAAGTNLIGDVANGVRTTTTNALSRLKILSAATTNATVVKASAGRVYGWNLTNTSAAFKFVKFHNLAAAPTVGTTPVTDTIAIPPNSSIVVLGQIGVFYSTGIAISITNLAADADATAIAANDVIGNIYFA